MEAEDFGEEKLEKLEEDLEDLGGRSWRGSWRSWRRSLRLTMEDFGEEELERKCDNSRSEGSNAASSESSRIWVVDWRWVTKNPVWVDYYREEENGVGEQEEDCHDQLQPPDVALNKHLDTEEDINCSHLELSLPRPPQLEVVDNSAM